MFAYAACMFRETFPCDNFILTSTKAPGDILRERHKTYLRQKIDALLPIEQCFCGPLSSPAAERPPGVSPHSHASEGRMTCKGKFLGNGLMFI